MPDLNDAHEAIKTLAVPQGAVMGDPEAGDPFVGLEEGMAPLPEDTDRDRLIAAYDVVGRCGLWDFEVGFDDEKDEGARWYSGARFGDGRAVVVTERANAHEAAEALARKLVNGGRCTHCGRVATLWTQGPEDDAGVGQLNRSWICYWTREGRAWVRGCVDTHEENARTKEAINDFIERTKSPAIKEV